MKLRAWLAIAAIAASLLQACGGNGGGGSGSVRLVNLSDDISPLDVYTYDGTTEAILTASSNVATDTAGAYSGIGATTITFNLKRTGTGTTSNTSTRTIGKDISYTLLAYSTNSVLKSVFLTENETAPSAGNAKLRVYNASIEAGPLDVYVVPAGNPVATPTLSSLPTERVSTYTEFGAGNYNIVVTGPGDVTDVRLNLASVALAAQEIATFVVTSTPGGVLVNGHVIDQQSSVTPHHNTSARVRLVAGGASGDVAAATVNSVVLSGAQSSPSVQSPYVLVPAGALTVSATLNGSAATPNGTTPLPANLAAGTDNTLLVSGVGTNGVVTLINDDNRPPLLGTNAKIRLVHGVGNLASPITLTVDFSTVANNVATNSASTPVSIPATAANTTTELDYSSPGITPPATNCTGGFCSRQVVLRAGGVYTVFALGDGSILDGTGITTVLRKDR